FIQLYGTEGKWGCYVVEVPGAGALNPERHMYEEIMVVVEGRGTTEIWTDDQKKPHTFEWQRGSMFSIPLNCWHRIINAASSRAWPTTCSTASSASTRPGVIRRHTRTCLRRYWSVSKVRATPIHGRVVTA